MYKNIITAENTPDSHKEVIKGQISYQLEQAAANENLEAIKSHFKWVLANDFYKKGDVVKAQVLTLDKETRKMSLGVKQMTPDPWSEIEANFPVGSKHSVKVRNFTNFGIFVEERHPTAVIKYVHTNSRPSSVLTIHLFSDWE